jgi:hypothetical protein
MAAQLHERSTMSKVVLLWSVPVVVLVAACATPQPPAAGEEQQLAAARSALAADVRACSARYGFDPATATGLGERELAPQELNWRQCAYDAGRRYSDRNPPLRGLMEQLIAEDIEMTRAIQQGTFTRSERRARMQALLEQLRAEEQRQISAASAEQQRKAEEMTNVVEGLRGFSY